MSHTAEISIVMEDSQAIEAACNRMGVEVPGKVQKHKLFQTEEKGLGIQLPGWRFPIVITPEGNVRYDNYNGAWGNIEELNKFQSYYGVEKSKIEGRKKGYTVTEKFNEEEQEIELELS